MAHGLATPAQSADLLQRIGANSQRISVDWRWVEPAPDEYRWTKPDRLYAAARARGIRPVMMLLFAPSWTLGGACDQYKQDCTYPPTRAHLRDWAELARAVAARYPEAAGIEVWNEPNMSWFWKPGPDPALYVDLLREAYRAVKAVNPAMPVAGGSMANTGTTNSTSMSLVDFTRAIYARGAKSVTDAISLHPYPNSLDMNRVTRNLNQVRAIRDEYGDSAKPLWVTETGLTTTGSGAAGTPFRATEAQQATGLVQMLRTLRSQPDVRVVLLHVLVEKKSAWYTNPADPRDPQVGYGVVRQDLSPKPAFCALATARGRSCP